MNSKNTILIIVALLILGGAGFYLVSNSSTTEEPSTPVADKMMNDNSANLEPKDDAMMVSVPSTAYQYEITEGTASYTAQKRFLEKEDDVVVATTEGVSGTGWFDPETGDTYLKAEVTLAGLASDSSSRDSDVLKMFNPALVSVELNSESTGVAMNEEYTSTVPVMVTINGTTLAVEFDITALVTEESFTATGSAVVPMSAFNLKAPSLVGVYTVDDEVELSFDVSGEVTQAPEAMMEEEDETTGDTMMEEETTEDVTQ